MIDEASRTVASNAAACPEVFPQSRGIGRRFLVQRLPEAGGAVQLSEEAAHHVATLRLDVGTAVRLFDGRGLEASGRIARIDANGVECEVGVPQAEPVLPLRTVLLQALPKGAKLDLIIRMATELDVSAVHIVATQRAVPQPDDERVAHRLQRLQRIAAEAARQCERSTVPALHAPVPLLQAAALAPASALRIVFWEETLQGLALPAASADGGVAEAWMVIGPEGGLTATEVEGLNALGYQSASLGPSLLRVETAAVVAITMVQTALGLRGLPTRRQDLVSARGARGADAAISALGGSLR